jgi:hypothetical protein
VQAPGEQAVIDLTKLTQEQLWGLQFVVLQANAPIQAANEALPEGEELKPLFTDASYAEMIFKSACDSYYQQLVEHKKKSALQMFDSLRPEQQAALVQQLQIPDVLPQ